MNKLNKVEVEDLTKQTLKSLYKMQLIDRKVTALGSANTKVVSLFTDLLNNLNPNDIFKYEEQQNEVKNAIGSLDRTHQDILSQIKNTYDKLQSTKTDIIELNTAYHSSLIDKHAEVEVWLNAHTKQIDALTERVNTYVDNSSSINYEEKLDDLSVKLIKIGDIVDRYDEQNKLIGKSIDESLDKIEKNIDSITKTIEFNKSAIAKSTDDIESFTRDVNMLTTTLKDVKIQLPDNPEDLFKSEEIDEIEEDDTHSTIKSIISKFFG